MVRIQQKFPALADGTLDLDAWLNHFNQYTHIKDIDLIKKAAKFANVSSLGLTTFYGQTCLEQGLEMADLLLEMQLDQETAAAAIIIGATRQVQLDNDTIIKNINQPTATLIKNVLQMDVLDNLEAQNHIQIDRLRKTFLAMTGDIRAVLIRLAERTCIMRRIKHITPKKRTLIARETMDIYAPLANRLGIGQIKWELEDNAFHFMHPDTYLEIAKFLAEKRTVREKKINEITSHLKKSLQKTGINADIYGRAKHIYSIYLKTKRKKTNYDQIFDCMAVRILVDNIEQCYAALSVAHELYHQIPEEFDDYISKPKPNGYRSIHTAVKDHDGKTLEIQIRSKLMHEEAEHGIAAHWMYKEASDVAKNQENRIRFIRQLLAWKGDIARELSNTSADLSDNIIYVFTPRGEIIDLPIGATPLDFAYKIHTEIGHRCKGAKIAGSIVPLTRTLQTGDSVEIITASKANPSRDWLSKHEGYLKTNRARSKVAHWLRQQKPPTDTVTQKTTIKKNTCAPKKLLPSYPEKEKQTKQPTIADINDFLTRIALCCNPTEKDAITGYITKGRGISIHRTNCNNIISSIKRDSKRVISVNWDTQKTVDNTKRKK